MGKAKKNKYTIDADYTLPQLTGGANPCVTFHYAGLDGAVREWRVAVSRCALASADVLVTRLSRLLASGWRPDALPGRERGELLLAVLEDYANYVDEMGRLGSMRPKTVYDYNSRLLVLKEYAVRREKWLVSDFGVSYATRFLDWLVSFRKVGAVTRNNYLTWLSALCTWMWERGIIADNFARRIRPLREPPKKRDALSAEEMRRVCGWFAAHDRWMLLACRMEYYTMIRPGELVRLRLCDLDLEGRRVRCRAEWTKNRKDEWVALNASLVAELRGLGVDGMPRDWFLFGRHVRPGRRPADSQVFNRRWKVMRDEVGLPSSVQFYSLKDSGIRDLANAEGIIVARDQARHADVSTTNLYVKNTGTVHQEAKDFEGAM